MAHVNKSASSSAQLRAAHGLGMVRNGLRVAIEADTMTGSLVRRYSSRSSPTRHSCSSSSLLVSSVPPRASSSCSSLSTCSCSVSLSTTCCASKPIQVVCRLIGFVVRSLAAVSADLCTQRCGATQEPVLLDDRTAHLARYCRSCKGVPKSTCANEPLVHLR